MPTWILPTLWLAWWAIWIVMSRGLKPVVERETVASRLQHLVPLVVAVYLLFFVRGLPVSFLFARVLPHASWVPWTGAAATLIGLLFAVWARVELGGNWSGLVTLKRGHELVTTGPYALARHPIYTGLLTGLAGTAFAIGEVRGILALALALAGIYRKLRVEEAVMRRQFGTAYDRYAERVKALIPLVL